MGAKWDKVLDNTILEWIFKQSVVREDNKGTSESNNVGQHATPKDDEGIIGGSAVQQTASAHDVMGVIAPWTEPLLVYFL